LAALVVEALLAVQVRDLMVVRVRSLTVEEAVVLVVLASRCWRVYGLLEVVMVVSCRWVVLVLAFAVCLRILIVTTAKLACSLFAGWQSQEESMVRAWSEVWELNWLVLAVVERRIP